MTEPLQDILTDVAEGRYDADNVKADAIKLSDLRPIIRWFAGHREHVNRLILDAENEDVMFAPCKEDFRHPELWKAGSWRWLFWGYD